VNALHATLGSLVVGLSCLVGATFLASSAKPPPGVLVVSLSEEPRSLDPHVTTSSNDFRVAANVYEGLTRFEEGSLRVGPGLAQSWTISADGLSYVFSLRKGVTFHDGSPFDADAAKYNFERLLNPNHPEHDTGPFPLAFFFEKIDRVTAVDSHHLQLDLKEPFAPLLSNLAYPTGYMVSPTAVRKHRGDFGRHPVGTGRFAFVGWEAGHSISLRRNEAHAQPTASDRLIFRPITDPMTELAELESGGIDVSLSLPPDTVSQLRNDPLVTVTQTEGPHAWFLILNTKLPPFDDVRIRRAVNYAVNKEAIVEHVLQGAATELAGPIPSAFGKAATGTTPYAYDPQRARQLLDDAGPVVSPLTLLAPESGPGMLAPVEMATAIQADLAEVGVRVQVRTLEWNAYLAEVNAGLETAHMAEMAWMTNDPDTLPYLTLRGAAAPPNGFNSGWYRNATVDDLVELARKQTDAAGRARLYRSIQRKVHDDAPWLFVASWKQNAVHQRSVTGLALQPSFLVDFGGVDKR